jgi:hypothetical protein
MNSDEAASFVHHEQDMYSVQLADVYPVCCAIGLTPTETTGTVGVIEMMHCISVCVQLKTIEQFYGYCSWRPEPAPGCEYWFFN